MILGNPWGLLGLLAIPAVLAIHLFRRRFRPTPVTGLFLYGAVRVAPASGRRRERLRRTVSLLLELLAALAATWYLSDPHLEARETASHLVVVLDDRVRLQARGTGGQTTHERLRDELATVLDGVDSGERVTLIASGSPASILAGPEVAPEVARAKLDAWHARAPWHELDDALALARDLGRGGARTLVVSDRAPAGVGEEVGVLARGVALPTVGLVDVRWLLADDHGPERVVARVLAQGGAASRKLVLVGDDGTELGRVSLSLAGGEPRAVTLGFPPGASERPSVELTLEGDDPFAVDDRVSLVRPPARPVRVEVAGESPARARAGVDRALDAQAGLLRAGPGETPDLWIGVGEVATPPADRGTWLVRVRPGGAPPVLGPFLSAKGHPLLQGADFAGVVWASPATLPQLSQNDTPLLMAGDAVLVSEVAVGRDRQITFWVDLGASNLPVHPAWPALVTNLVEARRAALPWLTRVNLPLGEPLTMALPAGTDRVELVHPDGTSGWLVADHRGEVLVPGLRMPGQHTVGAAVLNGLPLDPRLADLRAAEAVERTPAGSGTTEVARVRDGLAHLLPLLLVLLAAALAWHAFGREERVGMRPERRR
jgi:hypothetical protein